MLHIFFLIQYNVFICSEHLTVAGRGALPSMDTLKKTVRRARRQNRTQMPVAPLSLILLEIPEVFKMYEGEPGHIEHFLLCDTGPGLDRILMFGRQKDIDVCKFNSLQLFYIIYFTSKVEK